MSRNTRAPRGVISLAGAAWLGPALTCRDWDCGFLAAAFAEAHRGDLLELDVNPLMVLKSGAVAVDALVVLAEG